MSETHNGSCLCGGVRYTVDGPLPDVTACHCTQCRKVTGHYFASVTVPEDRFTVQADDTLTWYKSSDIARRGFCSACGSTLFWDPSQEPRISILAGSFDGPTGVKITRHIFTETAGDYYDIPVGD